MDWFMGINVSVEIPNQIAATRRLNHIVALLVQGTQVPNAVDLTTGAISIK